MGGQNHQPTNRVRLIAPSAWLSQRVGQGFIEVLSANGELENAIITGMKHLHVDTFAPPLTQRADHYLDRAIEHLARSMEVVGEIEAAYENLLRAADAEGYRGNPLSSRIRDLGLPKAFEGALVVPLLNKAAWDAVETRVEQQNILATLAWEAEQFAPSRQMVQELIDVLHECRTIAIERGGRAMVEAIECNEVALRQKFARVFSIWNFLHAMFFYSALMMTELFYRTNSLGSLLASPATKEGRASA